MVERNTVEKMISLGPLFESGSAEGMKKCFYETNLTNFLEG